MKPRVFISTVSSELRSIRQLTSNLLQRLGYEPVWQDIFGTEPGDLTQMLRDKIDDCEGLICRVRLQPVRGARGQRQNSPHRGRASGAPEADRPRGRLPEGGHRRRLP